MMLKYYFKLLFNFSSKLQDSVISMLSVLFFSSYYTNRGIKELSDKKLCSDLYVFGNGPSLNDLLINNIDSIKERDVLVVNFFCNTEYFEILKPKYYIVIDPLFFSSNSDDNEQQNFKKFIEKLNCVSWKMSLFLPHQYRNSSLRKNVSNPNVKWIYINTTPLKGFVKVNYFLYNRNLGMPMPQTVINAAIFMAIRLKYEKIHLFGAEQSWLKNMHVDEKNIVRSELSHFYPANINIHAPSLSNLLLTQYNVFYGHELLEKYAVYSGCEILNHVKNSYIDAYEKV